MRERKFFAQHDFVTVEENTPNVSTPIFTLKPPVNSFLSAPRELFPKIRLKDANGDLLDATSILSLAVKADNQEVPKFFPGTFPLVPYNDLDIVQQRKPESRGSIRVDLGKRTAVDNNESLVFYLKSPQVVDWTQSSLEFDTTLETIG